MWLHSHRDHEKFIPSKFFIEDSQGNGRHFFGREMSPHEIMHNPIDIQRSLKPFFLFRISVGSSAEGGVATAKSTVEGFTVIGMDGAIVNVLRGFRVFWAGGFIFWTLPTGFVRLGSLVLDPDLHTLRERLAGASSFAGLDQFMTNLKQNASIPALPIGDQGNIPRSGNEVTQCSEGFPEQLSIFPPTLELPKEAAGSVHEHHRPSLGFIGGSVLAHSRIDLITFDDEFEKVMKQGIKKESSLDSGKAPLPVKQGILCHLKSSAGCIQAQPLGSGCDRLDDKADRGSDSGQEGVEGCGKVPPTGSALENISLPVVLGLVACMASRIIARTKRTSWRERFHDSNVLHSIDSQPNFRCFSSISPSPLARTFAFPTQLNQCLEAHEAA